MSNLKSLKFAVVPKVTQDAASKRRRKLIDRLEEQKLLVRDPSYVRTVKRWAKNEQGEKTLIEKQKRVHPWWSIDDSGTVVFAVRVGFKPIEFENGKAGVVVPSKDKLASVIDTLIAATRDGELDALLASAATPPKAKKQRRAA